MTHQPVARSFDTTRLLREQGATPAVDPKTRLRNAGHILGSAFVELEVDAAPRPVRMTFSGDLGPRDKALQPDPAPIGACDIR